jgi:N-methylhydantoinase A
MLLGVDTGGTFTDFVLLQGGTVCIHKVLSTPAAPEQAILQGIEKLGLSDAMGRGELLIIHGSTVATNAALEGKGVRTLYIGNEGLGDLLTIGRQARPHLYALAPPPVQQPVARELCVEVGARLDADGGEIRPLQQADLDRISEAIIAHEPQAVAINLLFSFLDDSAEKLIEQSIPAALFCSRSSFVLPEYKEYERGMATWLNAWLGPVVQGYVQRLASASQPSPVRIMQSAGSVIDAHLAARLAVNLLLSGPAGGLAAASYLSHKTECKRLLTFDMGGTSTDVALVDGKPALTSEGHIGPYPAAVPMVDMHTIGAGGGSIAYLDRGGALQVGPESAGADPGPACYGRGGNRPTVTDAQAVLGSLRPEAFLGGAMPLDIEAARKALGKLASRLDLTVERTAQGIIEIATEHMVRALRVISVQRGHDPRDYTLCCFGGAGGLHVCDIAENLGMTSAIIPVHSGVFSALGMLVAPRGRHLSRTLAGLLSDILPADLETEFLSLRQRGVQQLQEEGINEEQITASASLDLRYQGQSFTLNIPWEGDARQSEEAFHLAHEARYGHRLDLPVEVVTLRLALAADEQAINLPEAMTRAGEGEEQITLYGLGATRFLHRESLAAGSWLSGPLLIRETTATTLVKPGWQATRDSIGNLLLAKVMGVE